MRSMTDNQEKLRNESFREVLTSVKIENLDDLSEAQRGLRAADDDVRRIEIGDALVDTGATTLALPTYIIEQLGLKKVYEKQARSTRGVGPVSVYEAVRVTIQDRFCTVDVMEAPDDVPVLVGQIPLEMLDLVVDAQARKLTGNPEHNGEHILELYRISRITIDNVVGSTPSSVRFITRFAGRTRASNLPSKSQRGGNAEGEMIDDGIQRPH